MLSLLLGLTDPYVDLRVQLTAKMAELRIPGAALAVWKDGKVVLREGFGTTTIDGSRKVDGDTVFEAASLTKPVFAAAVLKLAEAGKLNLDTPLVNYLGGPYRHQQQPWNPLGKTDTVDDPRLAKLTARMVLSHRTGLPNIAFNGPLTFVREPNGPWGYSGEGYLFLQRAVEKLTGKSAAQLIQESVLDPLGMRRSALDATFDLRTLMENSTRGYSAEGKPVGGTLLGLAFGSLLTCLDDYVRFMEWSRRFKPFHRREVVADKKAGVEWGLGWGLAHDGKDACLFQWGWNDGYRNVALLNIRTGTGFVLFTNSDNGMELAKTLVPAVFGHGLPVAGFSMLGLQKP